MVKQAVEVVGFGVVEVEFQSGSVSERICKGLDNCKLSGVQSGIANSAQPGSANPKLPENMLSFEVKSGMNFHESYLNNSLRYKKYNPALTKQFLVFDGTIERNVQEVQVINWRKTGEMVGQL